MCVADQQIDIFGNEVSVDVIDKKIRQKKYRTMQEMYGELEGKQCRTCKHAVQHRQSKSWYKCELWAQTHSAATDIRLKNTACGKYEYSI